MTISRSELEWQELYEKHQESGISMSKFCKNNSIPISTYSKWKKKFDTELATPLKQLSPILVEKSKELELDLPEGIKLRLSF